MDDDQRAAHLINKLLKADIAPRLLGHTLYLQGQLAAKELRWNDVVAPMQRIRDEAHRFAVSRHRRRRSRRTLRTELTDIPGIGPVTAAKLLRAFGSLRGVRDADEESLRRVAGRRAAEALLARYRGAQGAEGEAPGGR